VAPGPAGIPGVIQANLREAIAEIGIPVGSLRQRRGRLGLLRRRALFLSGQVKHQSDSNAAFEAVSGLPRVGGITNRIQVITAGGD
jgi:hypothetical protein